MSIADIPSQALETNTKVKLIVIFFLIFICFSENTWSYNVDSPVGPEYQGCVTIGGKYIPNPFGEEDLLIPGTGTQFCCDRDFPILRNPVIQRLNLSFRDGTPETTALEDAAKRWNALIGPHLKLVSSDSTNLSINGASEIAYRSTDHFKPPSTPAQVNSVWSIEECGYTEKDMHWNNNPAINFHPEEDTLHQPYTISGRNMVGVAVHEFGHMLGLNHERNYYNIMGDDSTHVNRNGNKSYYGPGEDAVAGARTIYVSRFSAFDLGVSIFAYDKKATDNATETIDGKVVPTEYSRHSIRHLLGSGVSNGPICGPKIDGIYVLSRNDRVNCYDVHANKSVQVPFTLENNGSSRVDTVLTLYLSTNNIISVNDRPLISYHMSLTPDLPLEDYFPVTIPNDVNPNNAVDPNNNWYLGAIISRREGLLPPGSILEEVTQANNAAWYPIKIINNPPTVSTSLGLTGSVMSTNLNTTLVFNFKASDPDGDAFTFSIIEHPRHGTISVTNAGSFRYTPEDGFPALGTEAGNDQFTYRVKDRWGNYTESEINLIVKRPKRKVIISTINGNGRIVSNPEGIDCRKPLSPENCIAEFAVEGTVILSAIPDSGSIFLGWKGFNQCNGSFGCRLTIDSDQNMIAEFGIAPTSYTLTVSKIGSGSGNVTSSPLGIDCNSDCTEDFAAGTNTQVTLTPSPDSGSVFTGWNGACSGTGPCTVSMYSDKKVFASFTTGSPTLFNVSNLNDSGEGSFRQAVLNANNNPGDDIISFSNELNGTITLTTGQITISDSVSFNGRGADVIAISGNNASRVFKVIAGTLGTVTINDLTITEGNDTTGNGGGGIYIETGSVTLERVALTNNSANVDSGGGGGIRSFGPGALTISNSTVSGNSAFSIEQEGAGGGIKIDRDAERLSINNSTVSGNSAADGGGIALDEGTLIIYNSTISGNTAANGGGGIYNGGGKLIIGNSIIAGNIAPTEREIQNFSTFLSLGHNLLGQNRDAGIFTADTTLAGSDLVLAGSLNTLIDALADNGGPTQTHLLVAGGPAIDAGDNNILLDGVTTDQRASGFLRVSNGIVDIGAVEVNLNDNDNDGTPDEFDDDDDNGGAPDNWEREHGFNPLDANDEGQDRDNDGLTNVQELVQGTNPSDPDSDKDGLLDGEDPAPLSSFTLTVSKIGNGSGFVTSDAPGINCGSDCNENYPSDGNTLVTLTTTAFNDSTFRGWSGACSGTDTCTVAMSQNQTVTANFVPVIPYLVSNLNDKGTGSLRQAILDANSDSEESSISFADDLSGTITLTSGQVSITDPVTIAGLGANILAVSGNNAARIFKITLGANEAVTIYGLTLKEGHDVSGNGGGAMIINNGSVSIFHSVFANNSVTEGGGGAIRKSGSGTLAISNSTMFGNSAIDEFDQGEGGAIRFDDGILTVTNSTLSGNSSANGGGIAIDDGALTLSNSTLTGNSAINAGGGIFNGFSSVVLLGNNLIAGNIAPGDKEVQNFGTLISRGHNLFGENGSTGVTTGTTLSNNDLILANSINNVIFPLVDNGGATPSHLLVLEGPAIDAGNNDLIPDGVAYDQRGTGFSRINNGTVDIGAIELIIDTGGNTDCSGDNVTITPIIYSSGTVSDCSAPVSITTQGEVIIESGADVLYTSESIHLHPGFHTQAGGSFRGLATSPVSP